MRRIHRLHGSGFSVKPGADDVAEAVAAVAHWQELEDIARSRFAPARGNGPGGGPRGERAFEFVGNYQNLQRHVPVIQRAATIRNLKVGKPAVAKRSVCGILIADI